MVNAETFIQLTILLQKKLKGTKNPATNFF